MQRSQIPGQIRSPLLISEASGGNAALINANPTAFITIAELDTAGTTVGSIAGNGTIYLGSKNLTVGGNQQSTVFSGVIADDDAPPRSEDRRRAVHRRFLDKGWQWDADADGFEHLYGRHQSQWRYSRGK